MFIKKLNYISDVNITLNECNMLIDAYGWGNNNQICLTHKVDSNNIWFDSSGSLYNKETKKYIGDELDYRNWNIDSNWYIHQQVKSLECKESFKHGRVRIMRLLPKTGLSVHCDREYRYHLVLKTNTESYIAVNMNNIIAQSGVTTSAICYHIPCDCHWYKIDTRKKHWVYNGGNSERIHLVVCGE